MTTPPRSVQARIDWFLSHNPSKTGQCANWSWQSLGGDYGNPPAWGCPNANAVYDKVKGSGRYWTGTPKRGALVLWKYGKNGHAAICYDDAGTKIATTDPSTQGSTPTTGVEPISYPTKWGASSSARIWTDQYNGVRFDVGTPSISHGPVYLSKLVYGQDDSDSVSRLQLHLNSHSLAAPGNVTLPITGGYHDQTDTVVRADQDQHGAQFGESSADAAKKSSVGPKQAGHLWGTAPTCGCSIVNDLKPAPTPDPPEPGETVEFPLGIEYWYSGKPAGDLTFSGSYKRLDVPSWAPKKDGLTLGMLYLNTDGGGEYRVRLVREAYKGSDADPTAYQTFYPKSGDNLLVTHVWFESGEAGRPLHWEMCSMDGETFTVTTRYAKFVTIPWDVAVALAAQGKAA